MRGEMRGLGAGPEAAGIEILPIHHVDRTI